MYKIIQYSLLYFNSQIKFQNAKKAINHFTSLKRGPKLQYEQQLQLYGLEKQAQQGDTPIEKTSSRASQKQDDKLEAWKKYKGKRLELAQQQYVTLVKQILRKYDGQNFIHDF